MTDTDASACGAGGPVAVWFSAAGRADLLLQDKLLRYGYEYRIIYVSDIWIRYS